MKAVKANIDKEVALPFAEKPFHPTSSTKFILFLLPHIVFALECTQLLEIKTLLCICKVLSLCLEEIVSICGLGFFPLLYSLEELQICFCIFRSTFCESSPVNIYHSPHASQKRYSVVPLLASESIFWLLSTKTKKKRGSHV
jgi:hypothetical protein